MKKHSSIKSFFLLYISFSICLVLVFALFIKEAQDLYMNRTIKTAENSLEKLMITFENTLDTYKSSALILNKNADILKVGVMSSPPKASDVSIIRSVLGGISNQTSNMQNCRDYGLILPNGMIFMNSMFFTDGDSMYRHFHMIGCERYEDFLSFLTESEGTVSLFSEESFISSEANYSGIMFVMKLPINSKLNRTLFFVTIDSRYISSLFTLYEFTESADIFIHASDGTLLYSSADNPDASRVPKNSYISAYSTSYNLKVTATIDNTFFEIKIQDFKNLVLLFMVVYIILGVLLSITYSYGSSKPIRKLFRVAKSMETYININSHRSEENSESEYNFIRNVISQSQVFMEKSHDEISRQKEQLEFNTFCGLLDGKIKYSVWDKYFPDFGSHCYILLVECLLCQKNKELNHNLEYIIVADTAKKISPDNSLMYFINNNLIILMPEIVNDAVELHDILETLKVELLSIEGISFRIFFSSQAHNIYDVSNIYTRLRNMLRFAYNSDEILCCLENAGLNAVNTDDSEPPDSTYIYNLMLTCNIDQLHLTIEKSKNIFNTSRSIDEEEVRYNFYMYICAFKKLKCDLGRLNIYELPKYNSECSIETLFEQLRECADTLIAELKNRRRKYVNNFEKSIIEYIQEHAFDNNLYIKMIIDKFHITEATLQQAVKKQTGKTFFTFIEELRMNKAKRLIVETDVSINEILITCGYNSFNAFYKAFKKLYGVSPSAMREATSKSKEGDSDNRA